MKYHGGMPEEDYYTSVRINPAIVGLALVRSIADKLLSLMLNERPEKINLEIEFGETHAKIYYKTDGGQKTAIRLDDIVSYNR